LEQTLTNLNILKIEKYISTTASGEMMNVTIIYYSVDHIAQVR